MAHPTRNERGGLKVNPDGDPTFLDYFLVRRDDNVLEIGKAGIMRDNEEACRDEIEKTEGFERWCTLEDVEQINDHWRKVMIERFTRQMKKEVDNDVPIC